MEFSEILQKLNVLGDQDRIKSLKRAGIQTNTAVGISVQKLRLVAKDIGKNHKLALQLWDCDMHEAKILASIIDNPKLLTESQMERWILDCYSWDVCDALCGNLFDRSELAYNKACEWAKRPEEFVKRAGFALMAFFALKRHKFTDTDYDVFWSLIKEGATDERNFVKKAVNWALRQIGKRNLTLNKKAIEIGEEILLLNTRSSRWIAKDALKELKSEKVQERLKKS